jgi:NAD(P)-dependent dehydrogenase (short-subunit alcohol dehydrogenase family)
MSQRKSGSVVVTGTSTGIGRACALRLASGGWRVFAGVRRPEDGDALVREARGDLVPVLLEVTDAASVEQAAKQVGEAVGSAGLRGLVNNAGISVGGPVELQDRDELRRQFEVNLFGVVAVTQAFLPLLRLARGRIVNVSSGAGRVAMPLLGAYSASKFAVEGLSDALRIELRAAGIGVCVVEPGLIRTPFVEKGREDAARLRREWSETSLAYYGPRLERYLASIRRLERMASRPELVARVIQRALEARRPRSRYAAGADARMLLWLRRLLPDRAVDAVMAWTAGF